MRSDGNPSLKPSADGVLYVSAWSVSLKVRDRHLHVAARTGRDFTEARFAKVGRPRLRRLVIVSKGGAASWESLAWCKGAGVGVLVLDRSGNVLASTGERASGVPALRRAQVEATESEAGLRVVRYLLGRKLAGQGANLKQFFPEDREAIGVVTTAAERIESSRQVRDALLWEAKAASSYWRSFAKLQARFSGGDLGKIPERWCTLGERQSLLSASPRRAITPANAILNYLYQLALFGCSFSLEALGLDPQLGWAHKDAPYRDSAALDLLETVRPAIDGYVASLLADRTFSRKEFIELPDGQVKLAPSLSKLLAESTLARWERAAAEPAEEIARILASSARTPVTVRTRLTQADRKRGRAGAARVEGRRLPSACRMCGELLPVDDRGHARKICDPCFPSFDAERTEHLTTAGKQAFARMRARADDPAQSVAARAKRAEKSRQTSLAIRAWEREHGRASDRTRYAREILPIIRAMSVAELAPSTGLSKFYCRQVQHGERVLHEIHWEKLPGLSVR
jgi:CRISP-associated protein Cas1